jgi:hypothetical protein
MSNTDMAAHACVALTEAALKIGVDLNGLKAVTPLILLKAIKDKVATYSTGPIPFDELENQFLIFKINYAHHFGVPKEEIMRRLNVSAKVVSDSLWYYNNKGFRHKVTYKEKITDFLNKQNNQSC